ncbi:MAG: hypothetical protein NUV82_02160, partial [Candidatus Komeilibacteria bacterium]|nr:hypothetical protein [Candidatus Komeilibacteria bacterium]
MKKIPSYVFTFYCIILALGAIFFLTYGVISGNPFVIGIGVVFLLGVTMFIYFGRQIKIAGRNPYLLLVGPKFLLPLKQKLDSRFNVILLECANDTRDFLDKYNCQTMILYYDVEGTSIVNLLTVV